MGYILSLSFTVNYRFMLNERRAIVALGNINQALTFKINDS